MIVVVSSDRSDADDRGMRYSVVDREAED